MTARLRKAIYALFLLAFFITAPTVVLYTAGYRLNLGNLRVVKTGLLLVATTQKGADVFVDGTRSAGKTPVLIDNLLPGEHLVRVTRPGSIPWEKRLVIESQRTTFVQELVLFQDAAPAPEVTGQIGAFDVAGDGRVAYSMSQAGWLEIWTADADGGNRRLLSRVPEAPSVSLKLSKDGSFVSVETKGAKASELALVNATSGEQVRVGDLVPGAQDGWWDAARGDRFFVRAAGRAAGLYAVTLPSGAATKLSVPPESLPMSAMSDGDAFLVLIPAGNSLAITRWSGDRAELVSSVNAVSPLAFAPAPNGVLLLANAPGTANGRLILVNAKGGDTPVLLDAPAASFAWHDDQLLYTNGFDLHAFDASEKTNETLTRVSDPIVAVAWHPAGSVAVYAQASGVWAIELDERDHRTVTKLADGAAVRGAWIDPKAKTLRVVEILNGTAGIFARPL